MAKESVQRKLDRVRPPRVHITYNVETGGGVETRELPFVIGVMGDYSGLAERPNFSARRFRQIDFDSFDSVLAELNPRVRFQIRTSLTGGELVVDLNFHSLELTGGELVVDLNFHSLEDFEPERVV